MKEYGSAILKVIAEVAVGEDVNEAEAVGLEHGGDEAEELLVVLAVLHHLNGDDAVEGLLEGEVVDVGGDNRHVRQVPLLAARLRRD